MKRLLISFKIFLILTLLTGVIYPLIVTGVAQAGFAEKANGSLIITDNKIIGSRLIGQQFDSIIYFSSRPSSISYNPLPSGGSNLGLTNSKLKKLVTERRAGFVDFNNLDSLTEIPSEMLFSSASGLDPDISPEASILQVNRISEARNFNYTQKMQLLQLIEDVTEKPQFSILGETRLNVLILNLELDNIQKIDFNTN